MYAPLKNKAKKLRRYDVSELLELVSRTSSWRLRESGVVDQKIQSRGYHPQSRLRDYQLAFVVRLAVECHDKPRLSPRKLDLDALIEMCWWITEYQSPEQYPINGADDAHRFMMRIAHQQFADNVSHYATVARTYVLYTDCAKSVSSRLRFDLDAKLHEAIGLGFHQILDLTLALYHLATEGGEGAIQGPINIGNLEKHISQTQLDTYLGIIGASLDEYRSLARNQAMSFDPCGTFNPNPLFDKPMLHLAGDRWCVPISRYLLERGTSGIFYDLISRHDRDFASYFGYVFEEYVDRILQVLGPGLEIVREFTYRVRGQQYHSPDRIVLGHGKAVLIECKTKRLRIDTKCTADEDLLRRDLTDQGAPHDKGSVVSGVRQMHRFLNHVRQGVPGLQHLHEPMSGEVFPIVLVLDHYYFANAPYARRIMDEELAKSENPVSGFDYQILDVAGLETICTRSRDESFFELLGKKFTDPILRGSDPEAMLASVQMEAEAAKRHPVLEKAWAAFTSELQMRHGN